MTRILIAEDDPIIAGALEDDLTLEGYAVTVVHDGTTAASVATRDTFELIVLDVMLPGRDGFDICRDVRKAGKQTPILMLTARAQEAEKVMAFEQGADDYVTKPFGPKELRARIKALIRRAHPSHDDTAPAIYSFGDIELDVTRGEVRRAGQPVDVTLTEFKLLLVLARNRGRVLNRQQLIDGAWGTGVFLSDRTVDNHVVGLRKKIERVPAEPEYLVSVRGLGYRLDA